MSAGIAAVVASLVGGGTAEAANIGWSTAPLNGSFTEVNWTASNVPSASRTVRANNLDALFFAASSVTTLTNDRVGFTYGQLSFNGGAAAFTIGGNAFTLNSRIFNTSGNPLQTINNDIALGGGVDHLFQNSNSAASGNITLNGIISGANTADTVNKNGGNTVTFSGANTYAGATTVTAGVLSISNSSALGATTAGTTVASNAALYLSGGITVGAEPLSIVGGGAAAAANTGALRNVSGDNTYGGAITTANSTRFASDSGQLTLSNPAALNLTSGFAVFGGAGSTRITGVVSGTSAAVSRISLDGGVNNASTTLTLTGANTYVGGTTVNFGRLVTGNATALGDGTVSVGTIGATPTAATLTVGDGTTNTVGGINGLTINDGSTFETAGMNSQIALDSGVFTLGNVNLDLNNLFNAEGSYVLIDGVDGANAIGTTTFVDADTTGFSFAFNVVGNDGVLSVTAVPEPAALALIGVGSLIALRRRRTA